MEASKQLMIVLELTTNIKVTNILVMNGRCF